MVLTREQKSVPDPDLEMGSGEREGGHPDL